MLLLIATKTFEVFLLVVMLGLPYVSVHYAPKMKAFWASIDTWLNALRRARNYGNRHSPEAVALSRREMNRKQAIEDVAYFARWIQEHRNYLANAAPIY
jgi:hypothetical protein